MQEIIEKQKCTGCHACYSICPKRCIEMIYDDEGFLNPRINEENCIGCEACVRVCPLKQVRQPNPKGRAYACINNDENVRLKSSSGGVFSLLATEVINSGGVVFGAAFDDNFNVHHIDIDSISKLDLLRGSKYVQSRIGSSYAKAKEYLDEGRMVLFSGTPCQIGGLKSFLGKMYDNLILQDIVCHGVPSPLMWQKYIKYRENEAMSMTKKVFFRYKQYGWKMYSVMFEFANGTEYQQIVSKDLFMQGFLKDLYLRQSCYNCNFKSLRRESDLTLADFWGVDRIAPDMFDDKGTSLVFVNSAKGQGLLDKISRKATLKYVDIDVAVKHNLSACQSCRMPIKRHKVMKEISKADFYNIYIQFIREGFIERCFKKLRKCAGKLKKKILCEKGVKKSRN